MNTLLLAMTLGQFSCAGGSCSVQDRPGLFNRVGSSLFGGAHYNSRMVAPPANYFEAGACYGGSFAASCYSGAVNPQIVYVPISPAPTQQSAPPAPSPTSYRPRRPISDYPDLPAPELTTYGAKRPDDTTKWGVSRAEAIASWKRENSKNSEKPPKSRIVSPPPTGRPGTRFASNSGSDYVKNYVDSSPTPPGDPVRRIEVVSTVAEGRPFNLDRDDGARRPPPMTGIQDAGEAAGPPPKALYCPGCGGIRSGHVDQDDSETDCVVTCLHPGCTYRFSWKNTPAQWRAVMQRCPYCRAGLEYTNGSMQCTRCWFQFVIDQSEFNGEFRRASQ